MTLQEIPALFMRGGTSNALVFHVDDLPKDQNEWSDIFLAAMGSPDPNGRQLDGMGGGISSLSKVCVVGPPSRADADVDFTFAQVSVGSNLVDYAGNCGNMVSAMGPAALELGLVVAGQSGDFVVRIHNTNTAKIIVSRFAVHNGAASTEGELAIDGVAGTAAPIRLDFLAPGGSKTGNLLPTGKPIDKLRLPDGQEIEASLVDAANPCVFVAANDLNKTGIEHPEMLGRDVEFMAKMENIRCAGAVAMGLAADLATAKALPSIPKVAIISKPARMETLAGQSVTASEMSLGVRMLSMEQPHRAIPITGSICLAVAARIPGTLAQQFCTDADGPLTLSHPSGRILVDAEVEKRADGYHSVSGTVYRTARKLFSGAVHYQVPTAT